LVIRFNFSWVFVVGENELVGQSAAMRDVRRLIDIAAPAKTTILVLGATGTGKELVARSIHKFSARKGELISINSSAIPA
jgi:sigma-54 specific flagellar transcriptional regulator A